MTSIVGIDLSLSANDGAMPFRTSFSFVLDADGNGRATLQTRTSYSASLIVSAKSSVGGSWEFGVAGVGPLTFGIGPSVQMGPILVNSDDVIFVDLNGGKPGETITGIVWGIQSTNVERLIAATGPPPNSYAPYKPQQVLASGSVATGFSIRQSVSIPSGVLALALIVQITFGSSGTIDWTAFGDVTGVSYLSNAGGVVVPAATMPSGNYTFPVFGGIDTSVTFHTIGAPGVAFNWWVVGILDLAVVDVQGPSGNAVQVQTWPGAPSVNNIVIASGYTAGVIYTVPVLRTFFGSVWVTGVGGAGPFVTNSFTGSAVAQGITAPGVANTAVVPNVYLPPNASLTLFPNGSTNFAGGCSGVLL